MDSDITWKILDKYFSDNPTAFVNHHLESFNNFYGKDINQIFKEKNPIKIMKGQDSETKNFKYRANLYFFLKMVISYILENLLYLMKIVNIICILMKLD